MPPAAQRRRERRPARARTCARRSPPASRIPGEPRRTRCPYGTSVGTARSRATLPSGAPSRPARRWTCEPRPPRLRARPPEPPWRPSAPMRPLRPSRRAEPEGRSRTACAPARCRPGRRSPRRCPRRARRASPRPEPRTRTASRRPRSRLRRTAPATTRSRPPRCPRHPRRSGCGPRSSGLERGLGLLGHGLEPGGVAHRQVREHLAVELDLRLLAAGHELAVREVVLPRRRVDADDPERAHRALADLPVAVGVDERALDLLLGAAIAGVLETPVALRLLENLAALLACVDGSLDARHLSFPSPAACSPRGRRSERPPRRGRNH